MEKTFLLPTEQDCLLLGERLGKLFPRGGFFALYGDLGAGKSVFARGFAKAFGIERIQSPTFTILQAYDANPTLYHMDAYRLSGEEELYAIGYEDCLYDKANILLEWANIVPDALPEERMELHFQGSGQQARRLTVKAMGKLYEEALWKL